MMKVAYRPSTLYSVEKTLTKWIKNRWDKHDLSSITRLDVHEFILEVMPPETSQHTRKWVLKIIKRIFQMAVDHGKLSQNPCNGMLVKVPETDKKVLTSTEVGTFLNEAKVTNHRFYSIWTMALFTGCRSGELYALRWSDVDFETGTISVSRSWNSKNGFTSTKNQKTRVVPISGELARVMAIVGHSDMETTNVYLRKAGIELKGGTEKLGYKIPSDTGAEILQFQRS
jgi:integrase